MYTIIVSLGVSVILFTLILKASTALIGIPQYVWTWISGGIVGFFGLTLLFPEIWERLPFMGTLNISSNKLLGVGNQKKNLAGDVIMGAALGPVFSTCSPTYFVVLATVLPENLALGIIYLFAYTFGLCLMLLLLGYIGQRLADGLGFVADPRGGFKRALGLLFIAVAFFIISGQDKKLQIKILDAGFFDVTKIEQWLLRMTEPKKQEVVRTEEKENLLTLDEHMRVAKKEQLYQRAPKIMKPAGYVNTEGKPITIEEFRGKKVVLLDIWTYSCINCQRTIPYLNAWHDKYGEQGLQIIGIHTPEFAFEKDIENVEWAVQQFKIKYPSILDNEYATWKELGNNYWPRKYLVDIDGFIVYDHIGEGNYEETEAAIQRALMERSMVVGNGLVDSDIVATTIPVASRVGVRSPEVYFGAHRNELLGNGETHQIGEQKFSAPKQLQQNTLYLDGRWNIFSEYAEGDTPASITFRYIAKDVYMVASSLDGATVRILRDGKPIGESAGEDIDPVTSNGSIKENRLYKLIQDEAPGEHTLEIQVTGGKLQAYTFTFG
jgi:cytochrome c biogenesis protein CcdA/thiol-disulfide isomerase/thioredoxin